VSTNATTKNRQKPPRREIVGDNIPSDLRGMRRWVGWKWERNRNKWDKPPVSVVTGLKASKTDPASWTTFDDAMQAFNAGRIDGIGFCIAKKNDDHPADDPFVIIDVDNSLDADTGLPNDWATYLLEMFPDCYAEVSPSGHGIKIFVRAKLGPGKQSDDSKGIELLGPGSYVCVTGRICPGSPSAIDDGQDRIRYLQEDVVQDKSRTFATGMMSDRELALSALDGLADWRRDNYKPWIRVGQILHVKSRRQGAVVRLTTTPGRDAKLPSRWHLRRSAAS
jgi:primase-polymerase (primpol)-like protein